MIADVLFTEQMSREKLQRYRTFELGVFGFIDDTHSTLAELGDYLVMADALADHHDRGIVPSWYS